MIATGDFSQRVDFMGEFSESFNKMVIQLDETMQSLRLHEKELERLAHTDHLTGVNNRRYFIELLELELERCRRYPKSLSLLMLDIDHFKTVNDTYGHGAGDEALKSFVAMLNNSGLRNSDFAGRMGGEEFAVTLPETEMEIASGVVAERIRNSLEKRAIIYNGTRFFVTVSIGVAELRKEDSVQSILHRADQALYRAKTSGRNRVCTEQDL